MKRNFYSVLVAAMSAVAIVGCTSDDDVIVGGGAKKQLTFAAVMDGGSAQGHASERMKTQLADGHLVYFCSDDSISVFDGTDNNKFTTSDAGKTADFSGAAASVEKYTALYPYQADAKRMNKTTITAELPATQYAPAAADADTFDPKAVLSVATTTSSQMVLDFKNVCGLIKFETTEPLAKVVFKGNDEEGVAGNVIIAVGDAPTATGDAMAVTLKPLGEATSFAAGTYYISVLPQEFEHGFTLEAYKSGSTSADYKFEVSKSVELERSQILNVGKLEYDPFNGHDYVDLGIEVDGKKVLWATMNVGASSSEKFGDYYAWGETAPYYVAGWTTDGKTGTVKFVDTGGTWKSSLKDSSKGYGWANYAWCAGTNITLTKYCNNSNKGSNGYNDTLTQLELADDAARQNWGGDWVMPTQAEWQALCENTTNSWTTNYKGTGVNGYLFTSKSDTPKSIFLPAAGDFGGTSVMGVGTGGYYWSSSLKTSDPASAHNLLFSSASAKPASSNTRCYGLSVRPVLRMAK